MRSVRKLFAFAVLAALLVTAAGCGGSSSSSSGGVTNIVLWHGYVDTEGKAMKTMVAEFNASHPKIHVTAQFYGNSDYALQKVLTSIAGGHPPDIAYLYGSWAANIAQSPKTLALNSYIKDDPSFHWNDFCRPSARSRPSTAASSACPRWWTTSRSSTTRSSSAPPASPSRPRTGRGTTCAPPPRS